MSNKSDNNFAIRFQESEPKRCMFDLEDGCNKHPVYGHFIQEGLLKLIQDSKKQIMPFYNLRAKDWYELTVSYALDHAISPNEAAKCQFLCKEHEKFFWCVENPGPNWDDPEHLARLAFRACLINRYIREWFITFTSHFPFLHERPAAEKQQLSYATPFESVIRKYLNGDDRSQLRHKVARIKCRPILAAGGVILHPLPNASIHGNQNSQVIPLESSAIAVTILPAKEGQMVLFSYTLAGMLDAQDLLNRLEFHKGSIGTARLSKKLLEEMELIHMSPTAWAALGRPKQEFIIRYWKDSIDTTDNEFTISSSSVDLFTTH